MRQTTLRGRLALVATLITTGWLVATTAAVAFLLVGQLEGQADQLLQARAEAASAELVVSAEGQVRLVEGSPDESLDAGIWVFEGTRALESPARGRRLDDAVRQLIGRGTLAREVDGSRLYARPVLTRDGRQVGTVVAAVSLRPYEDSARLVVGGSAVVALLLLGSVYPVTRFAVGRALRPVADLSDQAARWSADDVTQRFGSAQRPRELATLAADLDGLLDRLSAVLRHEQQLSAEISHELRTPLTRITAEVELLQRDRGLAHRPTGGTDAGLAAVLASAQQMEQILETLLATARSGSTAPPGRCVAVEALRAMAEQLVVPAHLRLTVTDDRGRTAAGVDAAVVQRIVSPLIDNALRHATSAVSVQTSRVPGGVRVVVSDDGPGVGELGEAAFDPGTTGSAHGGAGLGLALARRLSRAAGGDLTLLPTDHGAAFQVLLPPG